jgi:hypothetical protein
MPDSFPDHISLNKKNVPFYGPGFNEDEIMQGNPERTFGTGLTREVLAEQYILTVEYIPEVKDKPVRHLRR